MHLHGAGLTTDLAMALLPGGRGRTGTAYASVPWGNDGWEQSAHLGVSHAPEAEDAGRVVECPLPDVGKWALDGGEVGTRRGEWADPVARGVDGGEWEPAASGLGLS